MSIALFQDGTLPGWFLSSITICLMACLVNLILSKLFNRIAVTSSQNAIVKNAFLKGTRKPLIIMVWLVMVSWVMQIIQIDAVSPFFTDFINMNKAGFIILIAWAIMRTINYAEMNLLVLDQKALNKQFDPTTITAIGRLLKISTLVMAVLIIMQLLGFSVSGMLAFGGAGGLIVGYGAKDILANFFGGLIIYMDKPFGVGDWIRSPEKAIEGTVEYIGWRQTRIRTFEKRPLYVPNSTFSSIVVENPSRMENRRIKETIGLRYEDNARIESILADIRMYVHDHDGIDKNKTIMVNFNAFGHSSLDFFIYCFTKTTDWATYHMIKEQVLIDILKIIHQHNADIAFPTQTIDLPNKAFCNKEDGNMQPSHY